MDNSKRLENLKNKTFCLTGGLDLIERKKHNLINYKHNIDTTVIYTDIRTFNILNSELSTFLNQIQIIESNEAFKPKKETIMKSIESKKQLDDLQSKSKEKVNLTIFEPTEAQIRIQNALVDMLDKVQKNDKYIPQAKAVCDITNAMVNMEKSQIQLLQLASKLK